MPPLTQSPCWGCMCRRRRGCTLSRLRDQGACTLAKGGKVAAHWGCSGKRGPVLTLAFSAPGARRAELAFAQPNHVRIAAGRAEGALGGACEGAVQCGRAGAAGAQSQPALHAQHTQHTQHTQRRSGQAAPLLPVAVPMGHGMQDCSPSTPADMAGARMGKGKESGVSVCNAAKLTSIAARRAGHVRGGGRSIGVAPHTCKLAL